MKKALSAILAFLMVLSVICLASCGEKNDPAVTTEAPAVNDNTEAAGTTTVNFPDKDYNGDTFTVYFRNQSATNYRGMYIIPLEDSGDIIDEAAARRNMMVEDKYHIVFVGREASSPTSTLTKDLSGTIDYDIILDQRYKLSEFALKGALYNFNKLGIDFTTPWWDANCAKQYAVQGKLFFMANDVSVSNIAGCRFLYFNKGVLEDFKLTSPYDYAAKNEWVFENFINLVKGVAAPGDGEEFGVYGLLNEDGAVRNHMFTGIGGLKTGLDKDGKIICLLLEKDVMEKGSDFFSKMKDMFDDKTCTQTIGEACAKDAINSSSYVNNFAQARHLFSEGKFLFTHSSMNGTVDFGDMPRGYGIIMNPKYNSDQQSYYHMMDNNAIIWCIPNEETYADHERLALVMDYWAYCSKSTVMENYYELTMKTKRASDPTAAEMLDTIKGSIAYFPSDVFSISGVSDLISGASANGFTDGVVKRYSNQITKGLKTANDNIAKIKD